MIAWPGCAVPINGHQAAKFQRYNGSRTFDSIIKQIFQWFHEPESTRINFGVMYYPQPDMDGHIYGPISIEMAKTLKTIDGYIGLLLDLIDKDDYLRKNLNVIITSDHGMHEVDDVHVIRLEKIIDQSLYDAFGGRSFANIFVKNSTRFDRNWIRKNILLIVEFDIDRIYANLSGLTHYEVYKKADIPDEYHYQFNVRIGGRYSTILERLRLSLLLIRYFNCQSNWISTYAP